MAHLLCIGRYTHMAQNLDISTASAANQSMWVVNIIQDAAVNPAIRLHQDHSERRAYRGKAVGQALVCFALFGGSLSSGCTMHSNCAAEQE